MAKDNQTEVTLEKAPLGSEPRTSVVSAEPAVQVTAEWPNGVINYSPAEAQS